MYKYICIQICATICTYIYIHTITWTHTYDVNTYPKSNNINHFVPSLLSSAHTRSQKTQTEQGQPWSPLISCFLFNISLERLWFFFCFFFWRNITAAENWSHFLAAVHPEFILVFAEKGHCQLERGCFCAAAVAAAETDHIQLQSASTDWTRIHHWLLA